MAGFIITILYIFRKNVLKHSKTFFGRRRSPPDIETHKFPYFKKYFLGSFRDFSEYVGGPNRVWLRLVFRVA